MGSHPEGVLTVGISLTSLCTCLGSALIQFPMFDVYGTKGGGSDVVHRVMLRLIFCLSLSLSYFMIFSIVVLFFSAIDVSFFCKNVFLASSASALLYLLHLDIASLRFVTIPAVVSGISTFCISDFFLSLA
jgi:hypothetical protein